VKESEIQEMDQRLSGREESLAAPVTEDGKQSREDMLRDERPAVDEVLAEEQFRELIQQKLQAFRQTLEGPAHKKEAFLFDKRLLAEKPLTLQQVGKRFNISRERARQIEARLIKKIKSYLQAEIPDFKDSDFVLKK
jgi:RNA polymerase sigma-32 factor